jgi:hypothetical protein
MFTLNTRCIHCEFEGVLEILGSPYELPGSRIFRYQGHNPSTGYIHYQCPACDIILLVNPADILGESFVIDVRESSVRSGFLPTTCADTRAH